MNYSKIKTNNKFKYSVIIPAAGLGTRMKSYGPKPLIKLRKNETIISRQIELINKFLPNNEITVVTGFDSDKVFSHLSDLDGNIQVVQNPNYMTTNVVSSINTGLKVASSDKVIIVYGDLVFNENAFSKTAFVDESMMLIDDSGLMKDDEVGCIINNHYVENMLWGLPNKWAQIVYLEGKALKTVKSFVSQANTGRMFLFEILNAVLDRGIKIRAEVPKGLKVIDVDTSKDIDVAKSI